MKTTFVFDICGTLYRSNTTFDFLLFFLSSNKLYVWYDRFRKTVAWRLLNKLFRDYLHRDITRLIALRFLAGYTRNELLIAAQAFYDDNLKERENAEIINTLKLVLAKDDVEVMIASATIDVVAEIIAINLGVKIWYSSILDYDNSICQGKLRKDLLGKKKEYVFGNSEVKLDAVYTDDFSDIPLLAMAVEKVIIVYPKTSKRWKKVIRTRKWTARFIEC